MPPVTSAAEQRDETPRIHGEFLQIFAFRRVRLIGKVMRLMGDEALIDSHGQVKLHLNPVSVWE